MTPARSKFAAPVALALLFGASLAGRGTLGLRVETTGAASGGCGICARVENAGAEKSKPKPGKPGRKQEKARKAGMNVKVLHAPGFRAFAFVKKNAGREPGAPGVARFAAGAETLLKKPAPEASVDIWDAFG